MKVLFCQWPIEAIKFIPDSTKQFLQEALDTGYGERDLDSIFKELEEGSKQIWFLTVDDEFRAAVITQIVQYPLKRTCEVAYLGGVNMIDNVDQIDRIEEWARINECKDIQVYGRKGWARSLKPLGYKDRYVVIGKEL